MLRIGRNIVIFLFLTFLSCNKMKKTEFISFNEASNILKKSEILANGDIDFNDGTFFRMKDSIIVMPLNPLYSCVLFLDSNEFDICLKNKQFPINKSEFENEIALFKIEDHEVLLSKENDRILNELNIQLTPKKTTYQELQELTDRLKSNDDKQLFRLIYCYYFGYFLAKEIGIVQDVHFAFQKKFGSLTPNYEPVLMNIDNTKYYQLSEISWKVLCNELYLDEAIKLASCFPKRVNESIENISVMGW